MRPRSLVVVYLAIELGVAVSAACGEKEAAGPAGGEGGSATGGSSGNGGTSSGSGGAAGASTGGASGSAGSAGAAGSVPDAGPQCTPRAELPAPVPRTASVQGACAAAPNCGGALAGTNWELESVCLEREELFPQITSVCSAASNLTVIQAQPRGEATFTSSAAQVDVQVDVSVMVDFPNACHGCQCGQLESSLIAAGLTSASCNPVCAGGSCFCSFDETVSLNVDSAYSASGGSLEPASGASLSYCVTDGTLSLGGAGSATYTFRPPEALHTPEICDGKDNDGNGSVDDELVECPTCSNVGACAAGVVATCNGASGWSCLYTSSDWEANETRCDAVDNDCDGELNEGLDCRELCDGIDNDGVGGIDDSPGLSPACSNAGVCAQGFTAVCNGASGWACSATSTAFESAESACDGLDNDCNGLTDERCCTAGSAQLYYAYIDTDVTGTFIARADLDGNNALPLATLELATVLDVSIDPTGGKIYWANITEPAIWRSDLDGGNAQIALTAVSQPRLALDLAHRWMFWNRGDGVYRTNLDDLVDSVRLPVLVAPLTLAVDSQHGFLFMGAGNKVYRTLLDGSEPISTEEDLAVIGQVIEGIAVDPVGAKLYWASAGGLHRSNLDLTEPEKLLALSYPHHLHVAPVARRLYWSETSSKDIGVMDLGGTTPSYVGLEVNSVRFGTVVDCP